MRETGSGDTLSRPLVRGRADSELAFASLLGLHGAGVARPHLVRPGVVVGFVLLMALVVGLAGLGGML